MKYYELLQQKLKPYNCFIYSTKTKAEYRILYHIVNCNASQEIFQGSYKEIIAFIKGMNYLTNLGTLFK